MEDLEKLIKRLIAYPSEEEWFEFKENWFDADGIGEYISSLSNVAAMIGREQSYLIWGVKDKTHKLTNTTFDFNIDVKGEPLKYYLARLVTPDTNFEFRELFINKKRLVVLVIPAAKDTPTAFKGIRYLRIGSSKVKLNNYPEKESRLFYILRNGLPTIESEASLFQDLTFRKLFLYYEDKGIMLSKKTFKKNLNLLTKDGEYNILAQLLSDNCHMPIRVSIFSGTDKTAPLYAVREFGFNCLLYSLDKVLEYLDVLNVRQADERNRIVERKEVLLFNEAVYREALINAFCHNAWIDGNAPMITVYSNRIEILSRGPISPRQTLEGFFIGESVPVNQGLSDIFLQLHISERSGRGIPTITRVYGKKAFEFRQNSIAVTIPFQSIDEKPQYTTNEYPELSVTKKLILQEIRNNPNVTLKQLCSIFEINKSIIQKHLSYLTLNNYVKRIGSNRNGYWQVLESEQGSQHTNSTIKEEIDFSLYDNDNQLNDYQKLILQAIHMNPNITYNELMQSTGLKRTTLQKNISILRQDNRIIRIGSNKKGYWKLNDNLISKTN